MLPENVIFIGIIMNVIGLFSYFIDTIKGKIKPNRVSFCPLVLAPLLFFCSNKTRCWYFNHYDIEHGVITLFILAASFVNKKAYWKLTRFDFTCGAFSLVGLVLGKQHTWGISQYFWYLG